MINIAEWAKKHNILERVEKYLEWENALSNEFAGETFVSYKQEYTNEKGDFISYVFFYRRRNEDHRKYYPTLSKTHLKQEIPIWKKVFKKVGKPWSAAKRILCFYDKTLDKCYLSHSMDIGYGIGGNRCIVHIQCGEESFFDELKNFIKYWRKEPIPLNSPEWIEWAKGFIALAENNPCWNVTSYWEEVEELNDYISSFGDKSDTL